MFIPFSSVIINRNATFEGDFLNCISLRVENTEDRCNAKLASFVIAGIPFASSAFNGEHNKQKRHPRKITDFVL
ncbi:hypothetical protein T4B_534 [Trichinella pseudospiralis]|uniref:Uncharacterized protein n=1 Tax=Trichinella pseudospiralis TaxID=6337 RepID=A0A0V0XDW8_TRIPS|nr:hypothetical protein T4E_10666 [Trichinella pseudospiralis]KRY74457.1 hypothetical protein T4A_3872 [Trichinella pseudospiralis]KRZ03732.1 hypothetical protein T4B_534 [Trichinella pseudospiralis]KRZ37914.1 hypothetical protein T4C_3077 [Trichinella pseudospiralis]